MCSLRFTDHELNAALRRSLNKDLISFKPITLTAEVGIGQGAAAGGFSLRENAGARAIRGSRPRVEDLFSGGVVSDVDHQAPGQARIMNRLGGTCGAIGNRISRALVY